MTRSLSLWFALALGMALVPGVNAETVKTCTPEEYRNFYMLWGRELPIMNSHHLYVSSLPTRLVEEIHPREGQAVIYMVCSGTVSWFEGKQNLNSGGPLGGDASELFGLVDSDTGEGVGVVWRDRFAPFDQGGALAWVRYRTCIEWESSPQEAQPMVNNVGAWSAGLGWTAINGVSAAAADAYWLNPARTMVDAIADLWMSTSKTGCLQEHTMEQFSGAYEGKEFLTHYLQIDPGLGDIGTPGH